MKRTAFLSLVLTIVFAVVGLSAEEERKSYDLVVIGGTPGGIACAVRAAREGLNVLLVNRHAHLGGILTSGIGVWDTQFEGKRSPLYDEVRAAIIEYYRQTYGADSPQYRDALPGATGYTNGRFEPRVAELILDRLVVRESHLTVLRGFVPASVEREGSMLNAVVLRAMEGTKTMRVAGDAFVDATYEGDLAALAKVPYRVGREARSEYGEPHAGIAFMRPSAEPATPEDAKLGALHDQLKLRKFPGWQSLLPQSTGAADGAVQACNYRTILTTDPANRVPITKPTNYEAYFMKTLEIFSGIDSVPNGKFGWNRPQLLGRQTPYVEADWATRRQIEDEHWDATVGLLYFLQNDLTVPELVRQAWQKYGFAKDEFADNGNRPYELYIREARRIVGRTVFTEHDATLAPGLLRAPIHGDSIAFTDWYMDCHACTVARVPGGFDEGKMMLHHETFPAQIPYHCLLPQGVDNLLVPVCLSASHMGWGTVRLEPTWMQLGESAGLAAALAKQARMSPAALDADRLTRALCERHSMVSFFNDIDVSSTDAYVPAVEYFGTKGFFHDYNARMDDPLKAATGKAWVNGLAQLPAGKLEAMALARQVAEAERSEATMTPAEFAALLPASAKIQVPATQGAITRKEAMLLLFSLLP